jgi:cardiolipin synthase
VAKFRGNRKTLQPALPDFKGLNDLTLIYFAYFNILCFISRFLVQTCLYLYIGVSLPELLLKSKRSNWMSYLPYWLALIVYTSALLTIPSILLTRRGRPQAALTWIITLFTLPFVGLFSYWAFGRSYLSRPKRKRLKTDRAHQKAMIKLKEDLPEPPGSDWDLFVIKQLPKDEIEDIFPVTAGNRTKLLVDSDQAYPMLEKMIDAACQYIHIEFYIWEPDDTGKHFRDLLLKKIEAGVEVKIIVDAIGSPNAHREIFKPLRQAGAEVAVFHPWHFFTFQPRLNFRNHRKLVVIDGATGWLGGFNIGNEYTEKWHDTAIAVEGPAVDQLHQVFVEDWYFTTNEDLATKEYFGAWQERENNLIEDPTDFSSELCVIASGPQTIDNITHDSMFLAITRAKERIYITTPYFIPTNSIQTALRLAVYRGVDVRVLLPQESDNVIVQYAARSYYPDLLRSGVRIFEYEPGFLHSKSLVVDNDLSFIGSANFDIRSFRLNFEISTFIRSKPFCRKSKEMFERNLEVAHEITPEHIEKQGKCTELLQAAAQLLSPLL